MPASAAPSPTLSPLPSTSPAPSVSSRPTLPPFTGIVAASSCAADLVPGTEFPAPASPLPAPSGKPFRLHVPVLEYHRIVPTALAGNSKEGLVVAPETFSAQMDALANAGWQTITLAALADHLAAGTEPPARSFVVTFDDGWMDGFTYAFPILLAHGFVGTFFVIADRIGRPDFLGPSQIRSLAGAGNEIGDHSVHHLALTGYQPKGLTYEIDATAATIASITGSWPETLAYPLGKTNAAVQTAVAACKSMRVAVVEGGGGIEVWANRFRLGRLRVGPFTLPADLLARVQKA
jgi:peptidoglycan/xylan/chitin deacetylase (PgdA/CDA1 family)